MNQSKREYADYLTRLTRSTTKSMSEFNLELAVKEVGKGYGCSEMEMEESVRATIH